MRNRGPLSSRAPFTSYSPIFTCQIVVEIPSLRSFGETGVKAIYMSGYVGAQAKQEIENVLYKPFSLPELGRRVRSILDSDSEKNRLHAGSAAD